MMRGVSGADLSTAFYASEEDVVGTGSGRREPTVAWGNCVANAGRWRPARDVESAGGRRGRGGTEVVVCTETSDRGDGERDVSSERSGVHQRACASGCLGACFAISETPFDVSDVDGEEALTCIVASASNDSPALVTCIEDERVELQDGQRVTFSEDRRDDELDEAAFWRDCAKT